MRSLNNTGITIPGGFRWFCEESKAWVPARGSMPSYTDFIHACRKHCISNTIPIGAQWEEGIQNQLCATLDGDWCNEYGLPVRKSGGFGTQFHEVLQGTRTLLSWKIKHGGKLVETEEAQRRAAICVACPMNQPAIGCSSCNMETLRQAVILVVGGAQTAYDSQLKTCFVCGCELRAKVHLPLKCLQDQMSPEQKARLPGFCWLVPSP